MPVASASPIVLGQRSRNSLCLKNSRCLRTGENHAGEHFMLANVIGSVSSCIDGGCRCVSQSRTKIPRFRSTSRNSCRPRESPSSPRSCTFSSVLHEMSRSVRRRISSVRVPDDDAVCIDETGMPVPVSTKPNGKFEGTSGPSGIAPRRWLLSSSSAKRFGDAPHVLATNTKSPRASILKHKMRTHIRSRANKTARTTRPANPVSSLPAWIRTMRRAAPPLSQRSGRSPTGRAGGRSQPGTRDAKTSRSASAYIRARTSTASSSWFSRAKTKSPMRRTSACDATPSLGRWLGAADANGVGN